MVAVKACLLRRPGPIHSRPLLLEEVPEPIPGPSEIRVRVSACGICRTDLHVVEGDLKSPELPLVPGHQVVGVVDQRGDGAERFEAGDRVGIAWLGRTCGSCAYCRSQRENLCRSSRYTGYHLHGGYAEGTVVHQDFAYPIPTEFGDAEAAPLLCAGIIGYRALARAEVPPGGRVMLVGFGSSAHMVIQLAQHRGHEVYVVTRGAEHRELADRMGARWVGKPGETPPDEMHSAIVFAPAGEVVPDALEAVGPGGTVALAGIHMSDIPALDYEKHLFHEKRLQSVEANTRVDGNGLLKEAAEAGIRPYVTRFGLAEANEALIALKEDAINGSGVLVLRNDGDPLPIVPPRSLETG
ncbi:MAG: zinc-dependent alcohol dehydrogenase family protein [Longimicrobiales bacterium]